MVAVLILVISADRTFVGLWRSRRRFTHVAVGVVVPTGTQGKDVALDVVSRIRVPTARTLIRGGLVRISTRGRWVVTEGTLTLVVLTGMGW